MSNELNINEFLHVENWDEDLEYGELNLPSNINFGKGSEFGYTIYRMQSDNIRWCIFLVTDTYYILKQEFINNQWIELWFHQMNYDLIEAKDYAENDRKSDDYKH